METESGRIIVFARDPVPGKAKTRLIPALGETGAAKLHEKLINHTLTTVTSCNPVPAYLYCTDTESSPFFQSCAENYDVLLKQQEGTDLGMRMFNAFENALSTNSWALLIGTDCPSIVRADLMNAVEHLEAGIDAVIGPAVDGGYYLIGLRKNDDSLFNDMPWGTDQVFALTEKRMKTLNWTIKSLPLYRDIDRPEDLESLPGKYA